MGFGKLMVKTGLSKMMMIWLDSKLDVAHTKSKRGSPGGRHPCREATTTARGEFQLELVRVGMVRRRHQSTPIWVGGEATEQGWADGRLELRRGDQNSGENASLSRDSKAGADDSGAVRRYFWSEVRRPELELRGAVLAVRKGGRSGQFRQWTVTNEGLSGGRERER